MQLALLAGANPRICERGPLVRLSAGRWNIIIEGLEDSVLALDDNSGSSAKLNGVNKLDLRESGNFRIVFTERGREESINVYAINVPKSTTTS